MSEYSNENLASWPWSEHAATSRVDPQKGSGPAAPVRREGSGQAGYGAGKDKRQALPALQDSTRARVERLVRNFAYEVCGSGIAVVAHSATPGARDRFDKGRALSQGGRAVLLNMDKRLSQLELFAANAQPPLPRPPSEAPSTSKNSSTSNVVEEDNGSSTVSTSPTPRKALPTDRRGPPLFTFPLRSAMAIEKEICGEKPLIWISHASGPQHDLGLCFENIVQRDHAFICFRVFQKSLPEAASDALSSTEVVGAHQEPVRYA